MMINNFLGKQFPIIQAPMSAVQDSAVAIAFSNCSGLGSLPKQFSLQKNSGQNWLFSNPKQRIFLT
tara:strand:+ start:576 stop:773 length:198 start_codon:yes stop_codon:yes gene_type:complete